MEKTTLSIAQRYSAVRKRTETICAPLTVEDHVVQPIVDVSPPKWHLGHTTWFFEEFFLSKLDNYSRYHEDYAFVFNSYYENVGKRVLRVNRGNLTRPTVEEVRAYRSYVDDHMSEALEGDLTSNQLEILEIGLNHEEQHQELLVTDIKYILGHNPLFPAYGQWKEFEIQNWERDYVQVDEGVYEIGHPGEGFCYDNELARHKVYLQAFDISNKLVTNGEFMEFITAGGYENFNLWHAEGWDWVQREQANSPMHWYQIDGVWHWYSLQGLVPVNPDAPLTHISYYEAFAYAEWKGERLPTEFEWEAASDFFDWGQRWEWTESAYLPYPGFSKAEGAIGEYNGKFMVNQKVLRGASVATSPNHSRKTYRNFFHPQLRWQYTGLRLVKNA